MEVTMFRRANHWQAQAVRQPEQELRLASLDFRLPQSVVYDSVPI